MKKLFLLVVFFIPLARADVTLLLEHPRHPSLETDQYNIRCLKKCKIEIRAQESGKVTADRSIESQIKDLLKLYKENSFPKPAKKIERTLYKIKANDGGKAIEETLGYPMSYEGEEYAKYTRLISMIEGLKQKMISAIGEKK